jgi:hypothetical protein
VRMSRETGRESREGDGRPQASEGRAPGTVWPRCSRDVGPKDALQVSSPLDELPVQAFSFFISAALLCCGGRSSVMASRLGVGGQPLGAGADGTSVKIKRPSTVAGWMRLCLPILASSALWAAACTPAGNAASSETAASSSSTGSASPSENGGFVGVVYVNHKAGYTFHHPEGWVVVEGQQAGSVVIYAPPGDPRRSPANVSISLIPVPEGTDLESYYRQNIGFLRFIPGFRLGATHQESFAGFPAFSITYSVSPKGATFRALQITTLVDTTAYTAIYSSAPKTFKRYFVSAGLIVRSFKLT